MIPEEAPAEKQMAPLVHAPPGLGSVTVMDDPIQTEVLPAIGAGMGSIVIIPVVETTEEHPLTL